MGAPMKLPYKVITVLLPFSSLSGMVLAQELPLPRVLPSVAIEAVKPTINEEEIAKKLANPLANMISMPTQYEFSRGVGKNQGGSEQSLLFQPVVPFDLGGGDTFLVRPIVAGVRSEDVV